MSFDGNIDEEQPQDATRVIVGVSSQPGEDDEDEQQRRASEELAEELARLRRLGIFSTFVAMVMMSFIFLPLFYSIVLLLAGFWYAFSPCLSVLVMAWVQPFLTDGTTSRTSVEHNNKPLESMLDHATDIHHDAVVNFGFDETRQEVRSCEMARSSALVNKGPPEGVYKVVYAAEYFGRVLRTEGELWLQFQPKDNGWEIRGQSKSASTGGPASRIRDGYLNAQGDMYWLVDGSTSGKLIQYRGTYEFNTNEMHDGEFLSKDNSLKGRIVRLYLAQETRVELLMQQQTERTPSPREAMEAQDWGATDIIEMVAKSPTIT